jgi:hypothetical protein
MTSVTVVRGPRVYGWPDKTEGTATERDRAYVLPLGRALSRTYSTDAHFTQYATPNGRRLCKDALERGVEVPMTCITFDIDDPEMHGKKAPAREEWRAELRARMAKLHEAHPGAYYYETKGGARILYTLPSPTVLRTHDDGRRWSQAYAIAIAHLERVFGIEADRACGDWTRLFRLPHATREPGGKPEDRLIVGDPNNIGALRITATAEDLEVARATSKAFEQPRSIDFTPYVGGGEGLLFHVLKADRAVIGRHGSAAYLIRCPNEGQHTSGRTGDGSTLLYPAAHGEEIGAIHCMHSHCQSLRLGDWLGFFSEEQRDEARAKAGIKRRRNSAA